MSGVRRIILVTPVEGRLLYDIISYCDIIALIQQYVSVLPNHVCFALVCAMVVLLSSGHVVGLRLRGGFGFATVFNVAMT